MIQDIVVRIRIINWGLSNPFEYAENNYRHFIDEFKVGMTYAIDKVLKTFESKLKKLDTALNKLDDFKVNVKSDLHQEIITVLRDEAWLL